MAIDCSRRTLSARPEEQSWDRRTLSAAMSRGRGRCGARTLALCGVSRGDLVRRDGERTVDLQAFELGLNLHGGDVGGDLVSSASIMSSRGWVWTRTSKVFTNRCFVTGWKHFGHLRIERQYILFIGSTRLRTDSGPSAICYDWKSVQHTSLPARHPTYNLDHVRVSHPIATRRSSELTMGRSSGRMGGSVGCGDCAASSRVFAAAAEATVRHPPAAHLAPLARVTADFERTVARGVEQEAWHSTTRRACFRPPLSIGDMRGRR